MSSPLPTTKFIHPIFKMSQALPNTPLPTPLSTKFIKRILLTALPLIFTLTFSNALAHKVSPSIALLYSTISLTLLYLIAFLIHPSRHILNLFVLLSLPFQLPYKFPPSANILPHHTVFRHINTVVAIVYYVLAFLESRLRTRRNWWRCMRFGIPFLVVCNNFLLALVCVQFQLWFPRSRLAYDISLFMRNKCLVLSTIKFCLETMYVRLLQVKRALFGF